MLDLQHYFTDTKCFSITPPKHPCQVIREVTMILTVDEDIDFQKAETIFNAKQHYKMFPLDIPL